MEENLVLMMLGILIGMVLGVVTFAKTQPEIKTEELYRFCLVRNIPLEECAIPEKPFKKEIK